ncbi:MAG: hypothetical protein M3P45_04575 [Acidobacteriota bacterium]|nr:hypothetical protein [Acidobacteriota bacterium]
MRNRWFGIPFVLLCAFMLASLCAERVSAQSQSAEKPVLYTYVSEWAVPRAMWGDYLKSETEDTDMLKKAVADGTLVSFGSFAVLNHQEGSPTHGTWFSSGSLANILKFLEVLRNAPGATSAPLAAAKHWDYILQSRNYSSHSGTFTNGYLRVGSWHPKAGSSDPDAKIMKATMVALCEKLLADGALHGYQIDTETVHSSDPGTIYIALITNGPEGLDKFNTLLEETQKSNPAGWAGFGGTVDPAGHRDTIARIATMTHK